MSIFSVTTRISHKWLERKPKHELASIIMHNVDRIELFADRPDVANSQDRIAALEAERDALRAALTSMRFNCCQLGDFMYEPVRFASKELIAAIDAAMEQKP